MIPGKVDNYAGDGRLLQIKSEEDHRPLLLEAQLSAKLLAYLKDNLPNEPLNLTHIRRLTKLEDFDYEKYKGGHNDSNNDEKTITHVKRPHMTYLRVCICSTECVSSDEEIRSIVDRALSPDVIIEKRQCSKYQAYTKEQAEEWSTKSGWPIMFRGNPKAVVTELSASEVESMRRHLKSLAELSKQHKPNELPVSTLIVDPDSDKVIISRLDSRTANGNPINHSIMIALYEAAMLESERRRQLAAERSSRSSSLMPEEGTSRSSTPLNGQDGNSAGNSASNVVSNAFSTPPSLSTSTSTFSLSSTLDDQLAADEKNYLCLNLHIYTTHEPCPMCAMALVHSRIGRLIYIKPSPKTGAIEPTSGAGYSVHWNKVLNWKYEAWKWLDEGYEQTEDDRIISSVEEISPYTNA